jgi:hypothetical protein
MPGEPAVENLSYVDVRMAFGVTREKPEIFSLRHGLQECRNIPLAHFSGQLRDDRHKSKAMASAAARLVVGL